MHGTNLDIHRTILIVLLTLLSSIQAVQSGVEKPHSGKKHFDAFCVACHSGAMLEAPRVEALKLYAPQQIVDSLNNGVMSTQGLMLSNNEIREVAEYLSGKTLDAPKLAAPQFMCADQIAKSNTTNTSEWHGWGGQFGNQRFQANETEIKASNVANLKLKWAFGFPRSTRARSQAVVGKGIVYVGSQGGTIYALDIKTGCTYWTFDAGSEVRGSLKLQARASSSSDLLLFGDFKANAFALDANSGQLVWKRKVHDHPLATITGSVNADSDYVYVPVSSSEVVPAATETYPCCTFRGAVVALDLESGEFKWRYYTTDLPQATGKNSAGAQQFGPSGAPVWSSPTIDLKRQSVYITTGQNYSSPATGTSDSVIALDRTSGKVRWVSQVWANDAWNGGCSRKTANCPQENGPDFDIGASALLISIDEQRDLIMAGQKSGLVYAMDPDQDGKIVWQKRVGKGGTMGGVHWGMSSNGSSLFVGISDLPTRNPYVEGPAQPGLHAMNPSNGDFVWRKPLPNTCPKELKFFCFPGVSAAVSSSPGLVFAGSLDGRLHAFDSDNGDILWQHDTRQAYETVNSIEANGGAIEADGPVIAQGHLLVTSGYDKWGELPGNVLLVFSLLQSAQPETN